MFFNIYKYLFLHSDKPQRLPILDVAIRDIGGKGQQFGIELGPVCFT